MKLTHFSLCMITCHPPRTHEKLSFILLNASYPMKCTFHSTLLNVDNVVLPISTVTCAFGNQIPVFKITEQILMRLPKISN